MFTEAALTKSNMIAFLKEKGLYEECGEWCQPRYEQAEREKAAKKMAEPIGKRIFRWSGHYTGCCYEMSGDRFDHDIDWYYFVRSEELLPFKYNDPSWPEYKQNPDLCVKLKDTPTFARLCERMINFVNGDLPDYVDRCYDFDKFGFDNRPTDDQLKEWLGKIEISEKEANSTDNVDWLECFEGRSF